jgi:hypothetical protein
MTRATPVRPSKYFIKLDFLKVSITSINAKQMKYVTTLVKTFNKNLAAKLERFFKLNLSFFANFYCLLSRY